MGSDVTRRDGSWKGRLQNEKTVGGGGQKTNITTGGMIKPRERKTKHDQKEYDQERLTQRDMEWHPLIYTIELWMTMKKAAQS